MSNCLGLYIEENLIKYAKVSKEHNVIKVESFGIKFYDILDEAIRQVIEETDSQKTPISVNLSDEMYNYFDMFSLLKKQDLQKAIKTEFESYCVDKGDNPNVYETRYAIAENKLDKEKVRVIHVAANKMGIDKTTKQMEKFRLTSMTPLSMAVPALIDIDEVKNSLIVNIEGNTTITTIMDKKVYSVDRFEQGSREILNKINLRENSYSKSYEICKNTTIYTSEASNFEEDTVNYLDDIMPTLYEVIGNVRKIINSSVDKIEKVYITGTAALINNIDLYFQEYLSEVQCEILRPYFIDNTKDISIKDYMEVNSAIALGMIGLGEGVLGMNFKGQNGAIQMPSWLNIEIGSGKSKNKKSNSNSEKRSFSNIKGFGEFSWDLGQKFDKVETNLARISAGLIIVIIVYSAFSLKIGKELQEKEEEVQQFIADTNAQITIANNDTKKIQEKTNHYTTLINNLQEINDRITDRNRTRNAIPNLLNQIMSVIPRDVQITSIQNINGTHVVIDAQSNNYEQLGFFKAKLKTQVILTNVISTSGQKENDNITVRIEGDLP